MFGRYVLLIRNPIYSICWRNRYFRINKCWKGELLFFRGAFVPLQSLLGKFREAFVPRMKQKQIFRAVVCIGLRKNNIFASSNLSDGRKTKFSTYPRPTIVEKQSFQAFRHLDSVGFFWKNRQKGMILENKTSLVASAQHIQSVNIDVIELIESIAKNMNWKQGGNILRSIDLLIKIVLQNKDTFSSQIIDTISISIKICFIKYNKPNFHDTSVASIPENTIYDSYLFCLKCEIWLITLICFIYGGRLYLDDSSV